jgi:uncharacterized phage-associated protein
MTPTMNFYRAKLLNAVLFFAKKTKYISITKMCKLLHYLDLMHFRQTGYPSIGLKYYAFDNGPVPKDFWLEIRGGRVPDDFIGKFVFIDISEEYDPQFRFEFRAKTNPDMSVFSPREKEIMNNIVLMFRDLRAAEISRITHWRNEPWDLTRRERGANAEIDYFIGVENEDLDVTIEEAQESLKDFFAVTYNFHIKPTNDRGTS